MTNEVKLEMKIGQRNPAKDLNLLNLSHQNVLNVIIFWKIQVERNLLLKIALWFLERKNELCQ